MRRFPLHMALTVGLAMACTGCWTFGKSEYPPTALTPAQGEMAKAVIAVNGFETALTEYETFQSYTTVYVPGYYGRHHYHHGYYSVQPSYTTFAQTRPTDMFLKRAREQFEDAGFSVATGAVVPDVSVEVTFNGPFTQSGDAMTELGWLLFTAFLCDYDATEWTARLRVRDNQTGKIIFSHDYAQRYETHVFGLIPLFSVAACEETRPSRMQCWCLAALTDRAVADTTAFLATFRRAK